MWTRIAELLTAVWLFASHFIFGYDGSIDLICAIGIALFAALSFIDKLNKMHLLEVIPACALLYVSYTYPTPILPFALQNFILVALNILLFAILPSNASDHPRPWRHFLRKYHSTIK